MADNLIKRISASLETEKTLKGLVRQLLQTLELVTNMESTYLTRIESERNLQHVVFSHNSKKMQIPEGLSVPWGDSLCKRALDEGRRYMCDVPEHWGDSQAARELDIAAYVSTPVLLDDGSLYGTLCAASTQNQPINERSQQILQLFAELIAQYIQKEQLLQQLQEANEALTTVSYTDELTRLPNRRSIFNQLHQLFSRAHYTGRYVIIAFVDLDGFKHINDHYGHEVGDTFLFEVGQRLQQGIRAGDVLGRLGGDEFIVAGFGAATLAESLTVAQSLKTRLTALLIGCFELNACRIDYAGASIGAIAVNPVTVTPDDAMREADAVMYEEKKRRKSVQLCM
ncbi:sensor domain-containing diguanylate cyclase [Dickeya fangzhongdai]|uniref:sensor domain-containing diguanylate cyclase n=1 Tax=Dickeya fangzhongdai TaxID=1778540 RepID=UPI0004F693E6|nr:sensor domain-containing diguanylate cyclase [Dickeya fangzhongdai]AIR68294.1 diguanylate cyclase [Dickeya fangzhongdai]KGT99712.1 diguanylate cyclase [Dickeya fangzhongdai]